MLIEFKTSNKNTYGNRKYLAINTDKKTYSRYCPFITMDGIEIKTKDYKELIEKIKKEGYQEV